MTDSPLVPVILPNPARWPAAERDAALAAIAECATVAEARTMLAGLVLAREAGQYAAAAARPRRWWRRGRARRDT